ncbi:MAG: DUF3014 domain-containing protein [Proteobacteria bacterium]|nr:DUF3014 domain-containing protein [Pseudomonadota bacterium]
MENNTKKILIGLVLLIFIGIGLAFYLFFYHPSEEPTPIGPPGEKESPLPPSPQALQEKEKGISPIPYVGLEKSDERMRKGTKDLSPHPKIGEWLKNENIIRIITAAVDNIADGLSPRAHLGFLSPQKGFEVTGKSPKLYLDPQGFNRYNLVADVFSSLDAQASIRVYKELKLYFQGAYRELGYPNRDFQETLVRAMVELLRAPIIEGKILLEEEEEGINYRMVDDYLEDLSDAQKHLIRMGPKNVRKIQAKLREMALALEVPENQIPPAQVYATKKK